MIIIPLLLSHVAVGVICFFIGGDLMKKNIEKELLQVLEEYSSQIQK